MLISTWAGTAIIHNLFISNDQQPRTIESGIKTLKSKLLGAVPWDSNVGLWFQIIDF
jgi:hypothetical protein